MLRLTRKVDGLLDGLSVLYPEFGEPVIFVDRLICRYQSLRELNLGSIQCGVEIKCVRF